MNNALLSAHFLFADKPESTFTKNAAGSTGRCNTIQFVDSSMFPRTNPSVCPYAIKTQPGQRSC
jgi:hypothetical protein